MIVRKIEVYHVAMALKETWRTSFGEMAAVDSVIVRLTLDGADGWGEAAPYATPQYCGEFASGAYVAIRDCLGPALLGAEIPSGEALQQRLRPFKGNQFAKSALDAAWWDAFARLGNQPLWRAIGGSGPEVSVGADISVQEDTDSLIAAIGAAHDQGLKRAKLKFRPGFAVDTVRHVRDRFPDMAMHLDCNGGFTLRDLSLFQALDELDLTMIEQPLAHDDLIDHAALQAELRTPICLDESIVSLDKARKAIDIGACRWINVKVGRVGGLTNAIAIHDYCRDRAIPCWTGSMLESAIGQGASIALASLDNMRYPADIFPSDRFYRTDLGQPSIHLVGPSTARAPDGPGHGFTPRPQELARHTISHAVV